MSVETRLAAVAERATQRDIRNYEPTDAVRKLAAAQFHTTAPSFTRLAEEAGVSRSQLYRILSEPAAVHWIVSHGTNMAAASLGAVHARLFELAMTSRNITAIRLYLERFDPEFKKQKALQDGHNTQINFVTEMSDNELRRLVEQKTTQLLGTTASEPHVVSNPSVAGDEVPRVVQQGSTDDRLPDRNEWRRVAASGIPDPPVPAAPAERPDGSGGDSGGGE